MPAPVERDHADDLVELERERHDDGTHPRGDLAREAHEHRRVALRDGVVDRHPPVARADDVRLPRPDPRGECADRAVDVDDRVGLDVERGERLRVAAGRQSLAERGERGDEHHSILDEAPVLVHASRARVRDVHLEVEMLDTLLGRAPRPPRARARRRRLLAVPPARRRDPSAGRGAMRRAVRARTRPDVRPLPRRTRAPTRRSRRSPRARARSSWSTCAGGGTSCSKASHCSWRSGRSAGVAARTCTARDGSPFFLVRASRPRDPSLCLERPAAVNPLGRRRHSFLFASGIRQKRIPAA